MTFWSQIGTAVLHAVFIISADAVSQMAVNTWGTCFCAETLWQHQCIVQAVEMAVPEQLTVVIIRHALPCPALPCPALHCPALPCPALPCPALPCPA